GRVHSLVVLALWALEEPEVSHRRILRDDAGLGPRRPSPRALRDVPERRDAGLVRARFPAAEIRFCQRPARDPLPADVLRDRLVPQAPRARPAEEEAAQPAR